ncbi:MAG: hypothetical protein ABIQ59_12295 [Nocardioidaceae bacterium]
MTTAPHPRPRGLLATYTWVVLGTTLVTVLVAYRMVSKEPPTYTASTTVLVKVEPARTTPIAPNMGNEKQIAESGRVATLAADRLDVDGPEAWDRLRAGLSVAVLVDTTVLEFRYTSTDEQAAYNGTVAFSQAYLDYRNVQQPTRVAEIISPAHQTGTSSLGLIMMLGVGLLVGLVLGLVLAWGWDRLSDRFRNVADLERHSGLEVLHRVPALRGDLDPPWSGPRTRAEFAGVAARLTSTLGSTRSKRVILVVSPRAGAGTTTVAFETAVSLAALGRHVVVVDAHPGAMGLGLLLDQGSRPGLTNVVAGECSVEQVVRPTAVACVNAVPPGTLSRPTGQLDVDKLRRALSRLATHCIVLVDGPPVLDSPEALVLADLCHSVLLVADERAGTRADARETTRLLGTTAAVRLGWVANRPRHVRLRRSPMTRNPTSTSGWASPEPVVVPVVDPGLPLDRPHPRASLPSSQEL